MRILTKLGWAVALGSGVLMSTSARAQPAANSMDSANTEPSNSIKRESTVVHEAPKPSESKDKPSMPADEATQVLAQLHHENRWEIELARLAQGRAKDAQVRAFADLMVKDHTQMDAELTALAARRDVALTASVPTGKGDRLLFQRASQAHGGKVACPLCSDEMKSLERLKGLKGAAFDREYMSLMRTDHQQDIEQVSAALTKIQERDVQHLLERALSTLRDHQKKGTGYFSSVHPSPTEEK